MECFMGQIIQTGFNFAPPGWSTCQNQMMPVAQNAALFSLLGTYFGGNGQTTFGLPDARGRVFVGTGASPGFSSYTPGQKAGTENTTLLSTQMPAHSHAATFTPSGGTLNVELEAYADVPEAQTSNIPTEGAMLSNAYDPSAGGAPLIYAPVGATGQTVNLGGINVTGSAAGGAVAIGISGGSQPVSVMQPYLAVNTLIAIQGIFPTHQ